LSIFCYWTANAVERTGKILSLTEQRDLETFRRNVYAASRAAVIRAAFVAPLKLEFHDADTDTDDMSDQRDFINLFLWQVERHTDILATILARMSPRMLVSASWNASFIRRNDRNECVKNRRNALVSCAIVACNYCT